jgi:hypothetical protein
LVVLLAALMLLPGLLYFGLSLSLPGDASLPIIDSLTIRPQKLAVTVMYPASGGLQTGDLVTALQGTPVDRFFQAGQSPQPALAPGDTLDYSVQRGEQSLQIRAPLQPYKLSQLIRGDWTIYLYMVFVELVSLGVFILRPRLLPVQVFFLVSNLLVSSGLVFFLGLRVHDLLRPGMAALYFFGAVIQFAMMLAGLVHMALVFPRTHPLLERRAES